MSLRRNKKNLLSIICVVLNSREAIKKTLLSIGEQDLEDVEVIIIDGGSTDGTIEEIKKNSKIVDSFVSELDLGLYDAMNKGIRISKSKYIHFLNSGDVFYNKHSLEILKTVLNDEVVNLYKFQYLLDEELKEEKLSYFYLVRRMMNHQSMVYDSCLFEKHQFDENLTFASDYKHLLKILPILNIKYFDFPLIIFDANFSSKNRKNVSIIWEERAKILFENKNLNFFYRNLVGLFSYTMALFRKFIH
jgi:glycosyltransferase involved in cell wall biosynthesis|tara:strand:+ start:48 stop:788 length:741 start_codon:yes stop_codon:yes gene_type:complete